MPTPSDRANAAPTRRWALWALLLFSTRLGWALDPAKSLTQYLHTSWAQREGINLPPVAALAQTADGYLWLGTQKGLWRFDGVRFAPWSPHAGDRLPAEDIWSLRATRDGGLWVGTAAGVCKLEHGRLQSFGSAAGLPAGPVRALLEDSTRGLWAGRNGYGAGGLTRFGPHGQAAPYTVENGLPDEGINAVFEDRRGNLWAGTRRGLCRLRPGNPDLFFTSPADEIYSIAEDREGTLVVSGSRGLARLRPAGDRFEVSREDSSLAVRALLTDRDGNLWAGTFSQGLLRIRDGKTERFNRQDGLSGAVVQALFEDREGNLWAGTRSGVDRFRDARIARLSVMEGLSEDIVTTVCAGRDGAVWVGTANGGLNRVARGAIVRLGAGTGLPSDSILSLYEDAGGKLWAGTKAGLVSGSGSRFRMVPKPASGALDRVTAITGDRNGAIWIADARLGLFEIKDGRPRPLAAAGAPASKDAYALLADREGRLWIGYYHGAVAVAQGNSVTSFGAADGVSPGAVLALRQDTSGSVWAGTAGGFSRFRNGRWTAWTETQGLPAGGVLDILEDDRGGLWLRTAKGLLRVSAGELSRQADGSPAAFQSSLYGVWDGMRSEAGAVRAQPRAAKSSDGRLWFATEEGAATVDPAQIRINAVPPPVVLEQLLVDGRPVDLEGGAPARLALRGRELQFDFAALTLASADKVRFQYSLGGFDRGWIDAGARRQAFYTNLPPGDYRFRVIACNNDGVWNQAGAGIELALLPAFYQTRWFQSLCAALAAALMWVLYRLRLAQVARSIEVRLQERLAERTRIARELHDTLLQNVIGVSLQLATLAGRFPERPGGEKASLERIRRQVDQSLREARQSVQALRSPALEKSDLAAALRETGATLTAGHAIRFQMRVEGKARPLPPELEQELLRIGQEALGNAMLHSQAAEVHLSLVHEARWIGMRIFDNGRGIDAETLECGRPGHFGLRGMRERAERIGGLFSITSRPGAGTTITVRAPVVTGLRAAVLAVRHKADVLWRRIFRPAPADAEAGEPRLGPRQSRALELPPAPAGGDSGE